MRIPFLTEELIRKYAYEALKEYERDRRETRQFSAGCRRHIPEAF